MTTSIEISLQPINSIEVTNQSPSEISINGGVATSLEVAIATIGPRGEIGPAGKAGTEGAPGPNTIGGFGIQVAGLSVGDQLRFAGNYWENTQSTALTDGGNF